ACALGQVLDQLAPVGDRVGFDGAWAGHAGARWEDVERCRRSARAQGARRDRSSWLGVHPCYAILAMATLGYRSIQSDSTARASSMPSPACAENNCTVASLPSALRTWRSALACWLRPSLSALVSSTWLGSARARA